jgi:hypothetical protein
LLAEMLLGELGVGYLTWIDKRVTRTSCRGHAEPVPLLEFTS